TFQNCSQLESVTIGDGVTELESGAFSNCESLTAITIPGSVKSIRQYAFSGCSSLESITILNKDCEINDSVSIDKNATIYGYAGSTAEAYALKHEINFVEVEESTTAPTDTEILWGDANNDGEVNISDVVLMNRV
ncbi:MAG: leucine-rich repeat protein, partial [Oscillospiraceae bacterium]|nr:leucine-rich repeat protein [Oscillospiraceae bacterium]